MDVAQTINGGAGVFSTPVFTLDVTLKKPGDMSRAFFLALAFHVAGILLVIYAIQHWPIVAPAARHAGLELDLAPPSSAVPATPAMPDQTLVASSMELQGLVIPEAPVPEVRQAGIPEPVIMTALESGNRQQSAPLEPPRMGMSILAGHPQPMLLPVAPVGGGGGGHPIALSEIQPRYPYTSRVRGEAGTVTIHVHVTCQGEVSSVSVKRSSGYAALDTSALTAARKARFKPAEKEGKVVAADMDLQFEFRLEDG